MNTINEQAHNTNDDTKLAWVAPVLTKIDVLTNTHNAPDGDGDLVAGGAS